VEFTMRECEEKKISRGVLRESEGGERYLPKIKNLSQYFITFLT